MSRHGLDEVYTPPTGVRAVAHVVLVHGLFGHPRKTWTGRITRSRTTRFSSSRATSPSHTSTILEDTLSTNGGETAHTAHGNNEQVETDPDSVFWPQALLPSVIPDARIFTWGYDADIDGFLSTASQNTVHQHAINLLSDLADLRRSVEDKETPIIFLVHSLGGIIVKDALNESSQTEGTRLKEIAPATYAVCFLGTPHRGSSSASIGKLAYQIKVVATKRPNLKLLQALEKNSETLDRVGDSFRQTLLKQKIYIYSFREEKETRKCLWFSSIVVNADSAKIGDATEEVGSIPANHSDISKFATASDIGFKRVSSQLRRWIEGTRSREPGAKAFTQSGNSLQRIEALAEQITEKAQGVFIWVRLVVDRLEKGVRDGTPFSDLKGVVLKMPQELEDLYRDTLKRIEPEYADEAYIMLQIALCTLSPLPLQMFFKCVSYAKERVISDDQDQDSMTRHLVSRSGGLLEIVSRPMESSDFEGEVSRSEHEGSSEQAGSLGHGGSAAAQNQEFEQEAVVVRDTRPEVVVTVQFIHQTVKDFVRENRSDLGLRIHGIRRQNGYFYLLQSGIGFLAAGVKYDISIHIFEYASLAEKLLISLADEVDFQGELNRLVTSSHEMSTGWALRTWISMKHSPTFHILLILAMTRPQDVLTCLAVAAGLYRYVTHQISFSSQYWERTDMIMSSSPSLLQIAAVGDSIVLGRWDRLAMVKLLLSVDVPVDQQNFVAVFFDTPPNLLPHARTTLYWILNKRERLDVEIPENPPERLSIVRLLLENGANPNIILLKDTPNGLLRETALQHCVRSESEEMVRLFLQHGADPAPLNGWLPMNPFNRDFEMRRILEEHGCNYINPAGLYNDQRMIAAVGMMPAAITGLSIQERWVNNH
ncbi:Ankyrin repeat-containing domain [Lasallia pustulata]|uniref:Ankyrin repeat-containing domain n=1 Tax=Lasallia pustulata TaxID=136370 RepID=A0A1W5DCV4_9LECA|nr:Ankyrin repeat-containing domain [Lasallia pustulata]